MPIRHDEYPGGPSASTCTEETFRALLGSRVAPLLAIRLPAESASGSDAADAADGADFVVLQERAAHVENFLDDFEARGNKVFATLTECVASLRVFAEVGVILMRLLTKRGKGQRLEEPDWQPEFNAETRRTLGFVNRAISSLHGEVVRQCRDLEVGNGGASSAARMPEKVARARLPNDIDQAFVQDERRRIAEIGARYLAHLRILERQSAGGRFDDLEAMRRFVHEVSDEEECRFFETRVHNLLSRYDTYVRGTSVESADPDLLRFRSHVSATLKLLHVMTQLVHFYQRHENDIRFEAAKNRISELVDKEEVLDRILNYALYYTHRVMQGGVRYAEHLVRTYTDHARVEVVVPDGIALHVRPAHLIVKVVEHHGTPVEMVIDDARCFAGSVLQVLMTIGAHPAARRIAFEGDKTVLEDLRLLFDSGLGERGNLPPELSYLGLSSVPARRDGA